MRVIKSKGGYYYKIYKKEDKKKRISKEEYNKFKGIHLKKHIGGSNPTTINLYQDIPSTIVYLIYMEDAHGDIWLFFRFYALLHLKYNKPMKEKFFFGGRSKRELSNYIIELRNKTPEHPFLNNVSFNNSNSNKVIFNDIYYADSNLKKNDDKYLVSLDTIFRLESGPLNISLIAIPCEIEENFEIKSDREDLKVNKKVSYTELGVGDIFSFEEGLPIDIYFDIDHELTSLLDQLDSDICHQIFNTKNKSHILNYLKNSSFAFGYMTSNSGYSQLISVLTSPFFKTKRFEDNLPIIILTGKNSKWTINSNILSSLSHLGKIVPIGYIESSQYTLLRNIFHNKDVSCLSLPSGDNTIIDSIQSGKLPFYLNKSGSNFHFKYIIYTHLNDYVKNMKGFNKNLLIGLSKYLLEKSKVKDYRFRNNKIKYDYYINLGKYITLENIEFFQEIAPYLTQYTRNKLMDVL
jgi:hypothetical protein